MSRFLFHVFYYYWDKENRLLYRGPRYIKVRYIEVPLNHLTTTYCKTSKALK